MGVGVHEAREDYAAVEIEFFCAAGIRAFRQFAASADRCDAAVLD
jgi:hypothetical protein